MTRLKLSSILLLVSIMIPSTASTQEVAPVAFKNDTSAQTTVKCISRAPDHKGFTAVIPPGQTKGQNNFLTGKRVVGIWQSGDAAADVLDIQPLPRGQGYLVYIQKDPQTGKIHISLAIQQVN